MPYLIKAKGRPLVMRDGPEGQMYEVTNREWVIFQNLPAGTLPVGDVDVEVKEVTDVSEGVEGKSPEKAEPPKKKRGRPPKRAAMVTDPGDNEEPL